MNKTRSILLFGVFIFLQGCLYSHQYVPNIVKQGKLPNVNYVTENEIDNYVKKDKSTNTPFYTPEYFASNIKTTFENYDDVSICNASTRLYKGNKIWSSFYSDYVSEAKKRGLTCGVKENNKATTVSRTQNTKHSITSAELEKEKQKRIAIERKANEKERRLIEAKKKILELEQQNNELKKPKKLLNPSNEIGSGFYVSKFRHIVTNQHVVNQCKKITVGESMSTLIPANLIASDKRNDLAILQIVSMETVPRDKKFFLQKLKMKIDPIVSGGLMRSEDVSGGEEILVAGYPLGNMVSDTIKVTKGIVSATKGMDNDVSQFEIDAVIRKGNSGGPVYDKRGNIVGVAVSRLNVNRTDTINFGIKGSTVKQFLSTHGVPTKWSSRKDNIDTKDIYKIASKQTVMVVCHR